MVALRGQTVIFFKLFDCVFYDFAAFLHLLLFSKVAVNLTSQGHHRLYLFTPVSAN